MNPRKLSTYCRKLCCKNTTPFYVAKSYALVPSGVHREAAQIICDVPISKWFCKNLFRSINYHRRAMTLPKKPMTLRY